MSSYGVNIIEGFGSLGLFLSMFLEGSSLPFPGVIVILTLGYLLHPGFKEMFLLALGMSLTYSLASYIPYGIGRKFKTKVLGKLSNRFEKIQYWFRRYGELSICFTRPFGIGNYISYFAGMSKVKPLRYGLLTFFGILPWSFFMLLMANIYQGSMQTVYRVLTKFGIYLLILIAIVLLNRFVFQKKKVKAFDK